MSCAHGRTGSASDDHEESVACCVQSTCCVHCTPPCIIHACRRRLCRPPAHRLAASGPGGSERCSAARLALRPKTAPKNPSSRQWGQADPRAHARHGVCVSQRECERGRPGGARRPVARLNSRPNSPVSSARRHHCRSRSAPHRASTKEHTRAAQPAWPHRTPSMIPPTLQQRQAWRRPCPASGPATVASLWLAQPV